MKTAKEIFYKSIEGVSISNLETVVVQAMEEYAQQFKEPKQPELPKRWEDLEHLKGYFVSLTSDVSFWDKKKYEELEYSDMNVFATKEQAEAAIALAQLSQLREVYRQGWKPDWTNNEEIKYNIHFYEDSLETGLSVCISHFLTFQSAEIRTEFLENFRDLIEKAKPLMS